MELVFVHECARQYSDSARLAAMASSEVGTSTLVLHSTSVEVIDMVHRVFFDCERCTGGV